MSKTSKEAIQKRTEKVVEHTTSRGHLGGTNFGQSADAKTKHPIKAGDKSRPNDGKK